MNELKTVVSSENTISKKITYQFGKLIVIYLSVTVLLNSGCNNLQDARELTNKTQDSNNKFENSGAVNKIHEKKLSNKNFIDSANQISEIAGKNWDSLSNDEKSFYKSYNTRTMDYDDIIAFSNGVKKEFLLGDDLAQGLFLRYIEQILSHDQFVIFQENLMVSKRKLHEEHVRRQVH